MRGKGLCASAPHPLSRITPACAGKRPPAPCSSARLRDHPRVCGEKSSFNSTYVEKLRITPACAGKSFSRAAAWWGGWDHPRVCGEKTILTGSTGSRPGSPPRVRGKAGCRPRRARSPGITPACAGKRSLSRKIRTRSWDHPRVCGEKPSAHFVHDGPRGSPPRVRGKDPSTAAILHRGGITPACAGKSTPTRCACSATQDHPRVCGEKRSASPCRVHPSGSPPRVRGKAGSGRQ